jgi:hypothetical protein
VVAIVSVWMGGSNGSTSRSKRQNTRYVMVMFSAETVVASESVVDEVFGRPVALHNEAHGEAKVQGGRVALIANYRSFNTTGKGRKARGAGGAVLDLSAVSRIPAEDLPKLIARLKELSENLDAGIEQAERL